MQTTKQHTCPLLRCRQTTTNLKEHFITTHVPKHFYSATPTQVSFCLNVLAGMVVGNSGLVGLLALIKQKKFVPVGHVIEEQDLAFFRKLGEHFGEEMPSSLELYPINSESLMTHWAVLMQILQVAGIEAQTVFQQLSVASDAHSAPELPFEASMDDGNCVSQLASQVEGQQVPDNSRTVSAKCLDARRRRRHRRNQVRAERRRAERKQRSELVHLCPDRGLAKTVLVQSGPAESISACDATVEAESLSDISLEIGEAEREAVLGNEFAVPDKAVNGVESECTGEPDHSIKQWTVKTSPAAIDTHFHLDRLTNKLKAIGVPVPNTNMASVLEKGPQEHGNFSIRLSHAVAVFCDETTQMILLQGSKGRNSYGHSALLYEQLMIDQRMSFAFGLHPKAASQVRSRMGYRIEQLRSLLRLPRTVALGEVGLDYSASRAEWEDQRCVLSAVLRQLHADLGPRPVVVHCREPVKVIPMISESVSALSDLLQIMQKELHQDTPVQVHYFTGSKAEVDRWLTAFPNAYFSVGGAVMRLSKAKREGIAAIPDARLLLETDSPYDPPVRNRLNCSSPLLIGHVAHKVAEIRGRHWHQVLSQTVENATRLFNL